MRAALVALALALTTAARAAPEPTPSAWKTLTVGVLPVVHLGARGDDLFRERPETARLRALAARWHRGLEASLAGRDQVRVMHLADLRAKSRRLGATSRALELAERRYAEGLERWRALQAKDALARLDEARALHLEAFSDLLDPRTLSDIELHRGLALFDLGDPGASRLAFAQMFVHDPTRHFEQGYYGHKLEQELLGAAAGVAELADPLAVAFPTQRLEDLGRRLGVDVWAVGLVTGEGADAALSVALFDVRVGGFAARESLALGEEAALAEDLDRLVAAWHCCAIEAPRGFVRARPRSRWFVDFGYAHAVWIQHRRTRNYLHGPGAQIGITYEATPGLEVWARASQRSTLRDANGDLLDVFTTTHLGLGVGLAVGDERFRFAVRAGLEAAVSLADIAMTTDVDCKFFGAESDRCRGLFAAETPALWFGLDFSMSTRWAPTRSWYLAFNVGATSYALSGSVVSELNFPLYGGLGFGLPF